jgi:serine/tyrosine/threonine adenylyltransferase
VNNNNGFNFDNSYLSLPDKFFSIVNPSSASNPEMVLLNDDLLQQLQIISADKNLLTEVLSGNAVPNNTTPFAQAYAGHQFGHFTMLGDGRATLLGEHITTENKRFDVQLKGSGQTPYSRRGDGRATLKAMLREYLISEAMHYLHIPTSRSLAVIKTGSPVYRESVNEGAVLTRIMKSHIRVGTYEYARYFGTTDDLNALTNYTIKRLYPEIEHQEIPALSLLENVMRLQINLVAQWMRVGFIHGVMNTDNTSISGETFDYGPCAFMNTYHPETVFSSIDSGGRYAFGNQPKIIKWNITRLAETLLPLIHNDSATSIKLAQQAIDVFDLLWKEQYYETLLNKLGIENKKPEDYALVDELLQLMQTNQLDYTNTFSSLLLEIDFADNPIQKPELKPWFEKWKSRISENSSGFKTAKSIMQENNPVFIPRNHLVEEALNNAATGDFSLFNTLLNVLKTPYKYNENFHAYLLPPEPAFEKTYQTFCGT